MVQHVNYDHDIKYTCFFGKCYECHEGVSFWYEWLVAMIVDGWVPLFSYFDIWIWLFYKAKQFFVLNFVKNNDLDTMILFKITKFSSSNPKLIW